MELVIVCVGIQHAGNLGAIARLCNNFEVDRLVLVDPQCEINDEAYERATNGRWYLDNCEIVNTIKDASQYADILMGLSARQGGMKNLSRSPVDITEFVDNSKNLSGKLGLVFGRENKGLTNEELDYCDVLCTIPILTQNPVLNISHAVSISLWELMKRQSNSEDEPLHRVMSRSERDAFMTMLDNILKHSWINEDKYYGVRRVYRTLLGRSLITTREANTLIGTLRGILRSLEEGHPPWDVHD